MASSTSQRENLPRFPRGDKLFRVTGLYQKLVEEEMPGFLQS